MRWHERGRHIQDGVDIGFDQARANDKPSEGEHEDVGAQDREPSEEGAGRREAENSRDDKTGRKDDGKKLSNGKKKSVRDICDGQRPVHKIYRERKDRQEQRDQGTASETANRRFGQAYSKIQSAGVKGQRDDRKHEQ